MCDNPGISRFAFEIFRDQAKVIVFRANGENLGDVDVIELLRGARALFELRALGLIDSRERDELQ